ncbi:MAG: sulfotransferase family protein [bacterium]
MKTVFKKNVRNSLVQGIRAGLDAAGGQIEGQLILHQDVPTLPPIFVVGQSRAGSTLLYQVLCSHLQFAYLSNLASRFPRCPALVALITRILRRCSPVPCYESRFGITSGWWQPNSGYRLWKRWFGDATGRMTIKPQHETGAAEIIGTISLITQVCKRPFINKWTANTSRIVLFDELFPEALFVVISRSLVDIAQSQLRARRELKGDPSVPFVTWPRKYDPQDGEDYIEDICTHITRVEEGLKRSIELLGRDRFQEVRYEDLCACPAKIVRTVQAFYYKRTGYYVRTQAMEALPEEFTPSRSRKINSRDYQRLVVRLQELHKGSM